MVAQTIFMARPVVFLAQERYDNQISYMYISRTQTTTAGIVLAAIVTVGLILWLTRTPEEASDPISESVVVEVVQTPNPSPEQVPGSISDEAIAFVPVESPAVAGVTTTAPSGPTENALALFGVMILVGFSGSLLLTKLD